MAVDKNELILQFKFQSQKANTNVKKTNSALGNLRIKASGVRREIGGLRNDLLLASFAFAGVSAAIGKVVGVSARFEAVKTRLVGLTGSVENAEKAFDNFNKVASTTPFTLEDVVDAGAQLQAFGADANALIVPITDLAAFMGTTAVEAANAFGRAFAGGAGAADILRERGILNIIKSSQGLADLSKTTLPEFREALITSIQDPVVGIAGSSERLSKTFTGLTSNMVDSFTRLADAIGDSLMPVIRPLFETLKSGAERAESFIRGLTETSLETAIRELKEFEGTASEILQLQKFQLNIELLKLQKTLIDNNVQFKNSEEAQKALNKSLESSKNIIKDRTGLVIEEAKSEQDLLDINNKIEELENKRKENTLFRNREIFIQQAKQLENLVVQRKELIDRQKTVESNIEANEKDFEKSKEHTEELGKILEALKQIEAIRATLSETPVAPVPVKPSDGDDDETPEQKAKREADAAKKLRDEIRETSQVFSKFGRNISDAVVFGQNLGDAVVSSIKAIAAELIAQQATLGLLKIFFPNVGAASLAKDAGLGLLSSTGTVTSKLKSLFGFHQGGLIGSDGSNVPIIAQSGEFVMQRSAVQSIGLDSLASMNETGQAGNVTVNIHGGIVQEDYLRNELIPAINRSGVRVA